MKPTRFGLPVAAGFAATFLAATFLAALLPGAAQAQVSDDVVKIGVLTDIAGPASTPTGQGSVTAAQMAIDDFGGTALGKLIQLISADHQLKPDIGAGIARRWYDTEQVDLILDVPILLQKSPRRSCRIKIRNNRIGANGFLNQRCALTPDLESILRTQTGKILLQQNLPVSSVGLAV